MTGEMQLRLFWFSNATCDFSGFLDEATLIMDTPSETWTEMIFAAYESPATAQSLRTDLAVAKDLSGGSFEAKFDEVFLPEPTLSLGIAMGVCGLGWIGRRRRN